AAHLERITSAQDHAEVDVFGGRDDLVLEHPMYLIGETVLEAHPELLGRERFGIGRAVPVDYCLSLRIDAFDFALAILLQDVTVVGELVQCCTFEEALGESSVMCVENVRANFESHELEQHKGIHGKPE